MLKKLSTIARKPHVISFILLTVLPLMLNFLMHPGWMTPDSRNSLDQAVGLLPWSSHQPEAYGFLIWICTFGGNFIHGAVIVQVVIVALCTSYIVKHLASHMPKKVLLIAVVIFSIIPQVSYESSIVVKDVVFSSVFSLFLFLIMQIVTSKGELLAQKKFMFYLCISASSSFLLRKNASIIVCVALIALLIYLCRKSEQGNGLIMLRLIAPFAIIIITFTTLTTSILNPTPDESASAFNIPLQQIGATYCEHGTEIPDEDDKYFNDILTTNWCDKYTDYLADTLNFSIDLDKFEPSEFLGHWIHLGQSYPDSYLEGYYNHIKTVVNPLEFHNVDYKFLSPSSGTILSILMIFTGYLPLWFFGAIILTVFAIRRKSSLVLPLLTLDLYILSLFLTTPVMYIRYFLPVIFCSFWMVLITRHKSTLESG